MSLLLRPVRRRRKLPLVVSLNEFTATRVCNLSCGSCASRGVRSRPQKHLTCVDRRLLTHEESRSRTHNSPIAGSSPRPVRSGRSQSMSGPGSETGAADCAPMRPSAAIISQPRPLTCGNIGYQPDCPAVCSVVVLDIAGSRQPPTTGGAHEFGADQCKHRSTAFRGMSDFGSEMGAANLPQVSSGEVTMPPSRWLTCSNVGQQASCPTVCSVRIEVLRLL